jgi:SIR2-like protein
MVQSQTSPVIFLIGAGASADAGMPLVAQLTAELRDLLPHIHDINGKRHPEFLSLFDALAEYDPEIRYNYERFFEWLNFLHQGQTGSFRKATKFTLEQRLVDAVPHLRWSIKQPILEILRSRHQSDAYKPGYFAKLREFLPERGRLKAFTTNFDLCVEDACRSDGIDVITGFQSNTGRWTPAMFRTDRPGINLYKLHGSLNWYLNDNLNDQFLLERCPPEWDKDPELLLGPGSKLQHDDPFVTLYAEFYHATRRAKLVVAIGHSLRDDHIKQPIYNASRRGMRVLDINTSPSWHFDRDIKMRMRAKEAFESGEILKSVRKIELKR